MQIFVKEGMGFERGTLVSKRKINKKCFVDKKSLVSKKGAWIKRIGRTAEIKIIENIDGDDVAMLIVISQDEIFQIAKLMRRGRSDEVFYRAIEVAGAN